MIQVIDAETGEVLETSPQIQDGLAGACADAGDAAVYAYRDDIDGFWKYVSPMNADSTPNARAIRIEYA